MGNHDSIIEASCFGRLNRSSATFEMAPEHGVILSFIQDFNFG